MYFHVVYGGGRRRYGGTGRNSPHFFLMLNIHCYNVKKQVVENWVNNKECIFNVCDYNMLESNRLYPIIFRKIENSIKMTN